MLVDIAQFDQLAPEWRKYYQQGDSVKEYLSRLSTVALPQRIPILVALARWVVSNLDAEILAWVSVLYCRQFNVHGQTHQVEMPMNDCLPWTLNADGNLCRHVSTPAPDLTLGITDALAKFSGDQITVFQTESLAAFLAARIEERVPCR